jgi:signal transduction histidine kinase
MLNSLLDRLVRALSDTTRSWRARSAFFSLIIFPVLLVAVISSLRTYRDMTQAALDRRQAIASLAAATLRERIDRLIDLGLSLATRVDFRELVAQGHWEEAIQILQDIPKDFPAVERTFLADLQGTLRADVPAIPGVRGQSFSHRDWYTGVSRDWTPYLSGAYRRTAEPQYMVVAASFPIRREGGGPTGILVLQVKLDTFVAWTNEVNIEEGGFLYITDQRGRVVAHPRFPSHGEAQDFSGVAPVQKALQGGRGILIGWDPLEREERVAAYAQIPGYGWAVVVQQAAGSAFSVRNRTLAVMAAFYGVAVLLNVLLAYVILLVIGRLKHTTSLLEFSNKELETFSYSVSHDLRAPLRSIDGFSQALLEDCAHALDAEGKGHLQRIRGAAQRMAELIEALLSLSRVTRTEVRRERVDLSALSRAIAGELQRREPERRAEFAIAADLAAMGDLRLLRIALENLLGNAWKFTARRPAARIEFGALPISECEMRNAELNLRDQLPDSAIRNPQSAIYFVRDNGAGFDMAYADKLFGAFQRLHAQAEFGGIGIGLATVRRIIQRHGGQTWAEGEIDKGATFYFTLGQ